MSRQSIEEKSNSKRRMILDEAFAMIDEEGHESFSMRKLAQRLNMSVMGIYNYFSSREELLFEASKSLMGLYDNAPVPGEYWEDTIKRVCKSIQIANAAHPRIRIMIKAYSIEWPLDNSRSVFMLHSDQGMSRAAYEILYPVLSNYMKGFLDEETIRMVNGLNHIDSELDSGEWAEIWEYVYDSEKFLDGISLIVEGAKNRFSSEECDWRTPMDPSVWQWGREDHTVSDVSAAK